MADRPTIIYLWGFMGSGKSFLGKQLASALHIPFVDLDEYIENHHKKTIAEIFDEVGEQAFRKWETDALHECSKVLLSYTEKGRAGLNYAGVVSCGGGTPCFHDNIHFMKAQGRTVWLNPPLDVLVLRLQKERAHRPLIADISPDTLTEFISERLNQRSPYYRQADLIISPAEHVDEILNGL